MSAKEQLKLYNKKKLIDIIEKLSIEFAIKNQQYEYIRHNDYSKELQHRIEKAIEYIEQNEFYLDYKTGACIKGVMPLLDILRGEDNDN